MKSYRKRLNPYIQRMAEDMQLRNLADSTIDAYTYHVDKFCRHFGKPADQLGPEEIRQYQSTNMDSNCQRHYGRNCGRSCHWNYRRDGSLAAAPASNATVTATNEQTRSSAFRPNRAGTRPVRHGSQITSSSWHNRTPTVDFPPSPTRPASEKLVLRWPKLLN